MYNLRIYLQLFDGFVLYIFNKISKQKICFFFYFFILDFNFNTEG